MQHDLLPKAALGQKARDEEKEKKRERECGKKRVDGVDVTAKRKNDAVEHRRDAESAQDARGRQERLSYDQKDAHEKDGDLVETHESLHILTAEEDARRNESEQDAESRAARLDLHENGKEDHGDEKHLQKRQTDEFHTNTSFPTNLIVLFLIVFHKEKQKPAEDR